MNNLTFTGRLAADAKVVNKDNNSFISLSLFENRKGSKNILKCTHNIKKNEEPAVLQYLKKGTLVLVSGTPYAKLENDKSGNPVAVQSAFVDRIELLSSKD